MRHKTTFLFGLLLTVGAAFAFDRVVVLEESYSEG